MFSDFPNLHPLVVHFPIVLILLGAGLQALMVFKDWQQVRWGTLVIMGGGFAGALAASTIFHAMPTGLSAQATVVFNEHETYSSYTLWLSGITFLLRGISEFFKIYRRPYEILVLVFALAAAVVLSLAGHRGAQLVYVEGVGPKGNLLMKGGHHGGEEMENMEPGEGKQDSSHTGMEGDDHSQGGNSETGIDNMPSMDMPEGDNANTKPGTGQETNSGNRNMDQGTDMKNMAGMDHATGSQGKQTMGNMPSMSGSKKENAAKGKNMAGMDHSTMPGMSTQPKRKTLQPK
ncbi:DUF2231 domain-containing protein [Rufibacter sp. LB8]|uniref:DUF2231 domain-containing protein n=1 Tax=Rufibacter sp. LB8 TaxID=2777781 RepID=UPI00178C6D8F|nr:DUF2231 domain-containing protein [Rufibacter sp. LB8]